MEPLIGTNLFWRYQAEAIEKRICLGLVHKKKVIP
jgi:hypothetical protein